jgi:hypothetical protein
MKGFLFYCKKFLEYLFLTFSSNLKIVGNSSLNFYALIGIPSLINAGTGLGGKNCHFWTEKRANQWAKIWFRSSYIIDERNYPTK